MTAEHSGWDAYVAAVVCIDAPGGVVWVRPNGIKLSWNGHQPGDDFRQRRQPGRLAVLAGLVAASGALGVAFVAASGAARDEMTVVGDLGGQVGGELVKELRGKSIRSR